MAGRSALSLPAPTTTAAAAAGHAPRRAAPAATAPPAQAAQDVAEDDPAEDHLAEIRPPAPTAALIPIVEVGAGKFIGLVGELRSQPCLVARRRGVGGEQRLCLFEMSLCLGQPGP